MVLHLTIGYLILGVIAFLVVLIKYLLPDEKFNLYSKQEQRVFMLRRYLLLPMPFIALWPFIVAFIIFIPMVNRRAESKSALKEMKWLINTSTNNNLRSHGYAVGGPSWEFIRSSQSSIKPFKAKISFYWANMITKEDSYISWLQRSCPHFYNNPLIEEIILFLQVNNILIILLTHLKSTTMEDKLHKKVFRIIIFVIVCILMFYLCARMGDPDGVKRDPFRGVEDVF